MASSCNVDTGKLEKGAVLKAICAGFQEKTEPAVCLSPGKIILPGSSQFLHRPQKHLLMFILFQCTEDMETNECLTNNGGCWQNLKANITACKVFSGCLATFLLMSSAVLEKSKNIIGVIISALSKNNSLFAGHFSGEGV